jgi:predicted nucleic acid-binding Zn ribbon protein
MDSARPILQKLVADVLNRLPAEQVPVESWQFVCGKQVAERTQAVSFDTGVLRVEVPDARWQEQLQDLSRSYLAKLNQYSRTRVERIEFVVVGSGTAVKDFKGAAKSGRKRGAASEPERGNRWRKQK